MIYAVIEKGGTATARSFETWDQFHAETFCPRTNTTAVFSIPAFIPGKNYRERQHTTRNALQRAGIILGTPGLSWADVAAITEEAHKIARRAGLVREARENGII